MKGGKAEGMSVEDIAKKHGVSVDDIVDQLGIGIDIEMEHTDDEDLSLEIAMDHLVEFPDYYDRLVKMEEEAEEYFNSKESSSIEETYNPYNDKMYIIKLKDGRYIGPDGKTTLDASEALGFYSPTTAQEYAEMELSYYPWAYSFVERGSELAKNRSRN